MLSSHEQSVKMNRSDKRINAQIKKAKKHLEILHGSLNCIVGDGIPGIMCLPRTSGFRGVGLVTFVFAFANSIRKVVGISGSNRTPCKKAQQRHQ